MAEFDPISIEDLIVDPEGYLGTRIQEALPLLGKDPQDVTLRDVLSLAFKSGGVGRVGGSSGEHMAKAVAERGVRAGLGVKAQQYAPPTLERKFYPDALSPQEARAQYRRRKQQEEGWFVGDDGRLYQGNTQLAPDVPRDIGAARHMADNMLFYGIHSPDPSTDESSRYRNFMRAGKDAMDRKHNPKWVNGLADEHSLTPGERRTLGYSGD